jgi:hypothetical protein
MNEGRVHKPMTVLADTQRYSVSAHPLQVKNGVPQKMYSDLNILTSVYFSQSASCLKWLDMTPRQYVFLLQLSINSG